PTTALYTLSLHELFRSHISVASLVGALKANSSRWIHETFPQLKLFAWQKGYSAFSVCRRCERGVIKYIRNQEARHGPAREGGVRSEEHTSELQSRFDLV